MITRKNSLVPGKKEIIALLGRHHRLNEVNEVLIECLVRPFASGPTGVHGLLGAEGEMNLMRCQQGYYGLGWRTHEYGTCADQTRCGLAHTPDIRTGLRILSIAALARWSISIRRALTHMQCSLGAEENGNSGLERGKYRASERQCELTL